MPFFIAEPELSTTGALRARQRKLALIVVALVLISLLSTLLFNSRAFALPPAPQVTRTSASLESATAQNSVLDFSKFAHTNPTHARLPCLLCHHRENTGAQPRLPGHLPCSGCHTQQFADERSPICGICHTTPPAQDLKSFPPLTTFTARFDHARHTTGAARPAAGCAACHKSDRRGVGLTIPAGLNAHNACYQCHGPHAQSPAGQDISSCGTCHSLGRLTHTPTSAPAYQVNFSHAKHIAHKLSCNDCHTTRAGAPQRRQVTAPLPLMHHAPARTPSCAACHNGKRAFGGDDFTVCTRCHTGPQWHF
jgi:c(7)-type cytochrome triheme protein